MVSRWRRKWWHTGTAGTGAGGTAQAGNQVRGRRRVAGGSVPGGGLPAPASLGQPPENRVWQLQPCAVQNCAAGRAGGGVQIAPGRWPGARRPLQG